MRASLVTLLMASASTLVIRGNRKSAKGASRKIRFEAILRRAHQAAMERRGNRQHDGALGAVLRSQFDRRLTAAASPEITVCIGRVQVGWRYQCAIRCAGGRYPSLPRAPIP